MKKYIHIKIIALFLVLMSASCTKSEPNASENDEINLFVWRGLNTYYLWQKEVPDLADSRFTTKGQIYSYFSNFSPKGTFESLLYQKGTVDRFSWIVDDYVALENSFQGVTLSTGMEFGLVRFLGTPSNVFGYVRYVVPNSPAATAGVTRGMIFSKVDGTQITDSNFRDLLFSSATNFSIDLANYNAGNPISNGTSLNLTKTQVQENPVAITKVLDIDPTTKVGYLLYNGFVSNYDSQLNAAFATLQSGNITDLIIDLRYNGGGSVQTATYLASMITGQFGGQLFSKQVWNDKVAAAVSADRFINNFPTQISATNEAINSLQMPRVYFIVSKNSASASELVINGLNAYIDVKLVGKTTYGKHVGSITLYDSDDFTRNGANLNSHTWAMQPIVLEIKNKNDQNAPQGFTPEIDIAEDYGNMGVLGELSDPLLARTITYITTGARFSSSKTQELEEISNSKIVLPTSNNMYVDFDKTPKTTKKMFQ